MHRQISIAGLIGVLAALSFAPAASAASPELNLVTPRGAQRGTQLDLSFQGQRLSDAEEILFYSPGISVSHLSVQKDGSVLAHIAIAADARLGEYALRVRTATGISDLRTFWVSPYPIVEDTGKTHNAAPAHAMAIAINSTVLGRLQGDGVNYYRVDAKKGQRLSVEIVGMRLGTVVFDPYLQILSADAKKVLLTCDDTVFAMADPVVTGIAPYDGAYVLAVRESAYTALPNSWYMMHVGNFPRPTVVFPLGGQPGKPLAMQFLGDATGPIAQRIPVQATADGTIDVFAEQNGLISPTANQVRIDSCANVTSNNANHTTGSAMPVSEDLPLALNGILTKPSQRDFFRITVKAHRRLDIKVFARQLRSPLDSVLTISDAAGHQMAINDDQPTTPDSALQFDPPADGQYIVGIVDQLHRGGPDFVYRIEVTYAAPSIATTLLIPQNAKESYLQTASVPIGNRCAAVVRVDRNDFNGPIRLTATGLPAGLKMTSDPIPAGESVAAVVFQAGTDARPGGALVQVDAESLDPKTPVTGGFHFVTNLLEYDNNSSLRQLTTDRLAMAVTDASPVSISVAEPKTPLLQDGSLNLHVHIDRRAGFKGEVRLQMAVVPRGFQPAHLTVPGDQSDVIMSLGAEPNTAIGKIKLCLRGMLDNTGQIMISSDFFTVDVQPSPLQIKLPNLRVAIGGAATITCPIVQNTPLAAPAILQLLGLPAGCTANDQTISADDKQAKFIIHADPTCRPGNQQGIFLRISYTQAGEPVVLNLGRGTTIRITHARLQPPLSPPPAATSAKEAK